MNTWLTGLQNPLLKTFLKERSMWSQPTVGIWQNLLFLNPNFQPLLNLYLLPSHDWLLFSSPTPACVSSKHAHMHTLPISFPSTSLFSSLPSMTTHKRDSPPLWYLKEEEKTDSSPLILTAETKTCGYQNVHKFKNCGTLGFLPSHFYMGWIENAFYSSIPHIWE